MTGESKFDSRQEKKISSLNTRNVQTRPGGHITSYPIGTGGFLSAGIKRSKFEANNSHLPTVVSIFNDPWDTCVRNKNKGGRM
jgi:hypothetical protein